MLNVKESFSISDANDNKSNVVCVSSLVLNDPSLNIGVSLTGFISILKVISCVIDVTELSVDAVITIEDEPL